MIKISKMADYALALMARMAQEPGGIHTSTGLSRDAGLALPSVTKLLKALAKAELLRATRGKSGGYRLARDPSELTLLDIVEAIDGPLALTDCSQGEGSCAREGACLTKSALREVSALIAQSLKAVSLASLGARAQGPSVVRFESARRAKPPAESEALGAAPESGGSNGQ